METDRDHRQEAIERLKAKRAFTVHLRVYLLVNAFLVVIWLMTGRGYFWPIWPIIGWGIGLVAQRWSINKHKPISEDDIRQEMAKGE